MSRFLTDLSGIPGFDCKGEPTTIGSRWKKWRRSFEIFIEAKGVKDAKQKKAILLHAGGSDMQDIFYTLPEGEGDDEYEKAISELSKYFTPQINVPYERHLFRCMKQEQSETIEQYITRLRQKGEHCEFADIDEQIRDQVIEKCTSHKLRMKLLEKGRTLTLTQLREIARAMEVAELQASKIENVTEQVNKVNLKDKKSQKETAKGTVFRKDDQLCFRCGNSGHFARDRQCPARGKKCSKCGMMNHFSKCCKTTRTPRHSEKGRKHPRLQKVNFMGAEGESDDEYAFTIGGRFQGETVNVTVGGVGLEMLIDSGASCNVVDKDMWERMKIQGVRCTSRKIKKQLYAYGSDQPLELLGSFTANVTVPEGKSVSAEIVVINGKGQPLLGRKTALDLGVLKIGPDINAVNENPVIRKYADCFEGLGKLTNYQMKIPIDTNVQPVAQKLRRIPFSLRGKLSNKLNELEKLDIIEKVEGPTPWISPIVVVPKPNGDIRLCVDMRQANTAVIRERHPIPTIEEVLHDLNQSTVFSKLDLLSAYHQIELDEESRNITTFVTHKGLYRYKRLMFGISCAPEMYQRVMQQVLQDCEGVHNILDDIIVHGANKEQHDARLQQVLKKLQERGLTLNKDKCQFNMHQLTFMGHVLSEKGIGPTEARVKAVQEAREPKTASEVRSFLGLVNFSGRYIPDLATVSEPLRRLTRKNQPFVWKKEQQKSFEELKRRLGDAKTLGYFRVNDKTRIIADASPVGLGAVLVQEHKGENKVISYASRTLTDVERRYSQTEKEALALVWACEKFHPYLYGIEFEIVTDHKPLEFIYSKKSKPSARIERWVLRMQPYTFTVKYKPGSQNIADALSRLPMKQETAKRNVAEDYIRFVAETATPRAMTTREIERFSETDKELADVRNSLISGNWEKSEQRQYLSVRDELSIIGKVLLRGTRIVIPERLRNRVLVLAHEGHPGIVSMKQTLRTKVWWPGIDRDADRFVRTCHGCQLVSKPTDPEPMKRTELPRGPWQQLAADLLGPLPSGDYVFVVVDYYSRYYEIDIMKQITSGKIVSSLERMFMIHGLPLNITTDNGAQFRSDEFETFMEDNGIEHRNVTPLWPQANGEVERQNRSLLKRMRIAQAEGKDWKKETRKYIMMYRTSPHTTTGVTPAELMFKRKLRTKLPDLSLEQNNDLGVRDRDREMKEKGKQYGDETRHAKENDIKPGDKVLLKQKRENKFSTPYEPIPYQVINKHGNSVDIQSDDGVLYKRNVTHVKQYHEREKRDSESIDANDTNRQLQQTTDEKENTGDTNIQQRPIRIRKLPEKFKDYVLD